MISRGGQLSPGHLFIDNTDGVIIDILTPNSSSPLWITNSNNITIGNPANPNGVSLGQYIAFENSHGIEIMHSYSSWGDIRLLSGTSNVNIHDNHNLVDIQAYSSWWDTAVGSGIVIKDKNVESTTVLAMLSVILFGEYILPIK